MSNFKQDLQNLKQELINQIEKTEILDDLENLRVEYLGRKGKLTQMFKQVKDVTLEEKPVVGKLVNEVKTEVENIYQKIKKGITNQESVIKNANNKDVNDGGWSHANKKVFDETRPGIDQNIGTLHPNTLVKNELIDAFKFLGFEIYEGPEITSEQYAFDNMNFPVNHPARESMDTYWVKGGGKGKLCLRPHLTGTSVRFMQTHQPPFRFVYPGRAFRSEATDARHERTFYQFEALIVDKDISFAGGRVLIDTILERVFGKPIKTRMRAGFFPFVEPGFEIDMECQICGGTGCSTCGHSGWIEMMPGGAPHPNVFKFGGVDAKEWQGFYINIGLDRLAMMKYGINDVRLFHSGDLRFLKQF